MMLSNVEDGIFLAGLRWFNILMKNKKVVNRVVSLSMYFFFTDLQ